MGLAERRVAKKYETEQFPQLKKDIDAAAGFAVPIEVKWETLAVEGESHLYEDCWTKVYFQPLIQAFKSITQDDMGKAALKDGLKSIVIQNVGGFYSASSVYTFQGGLLTVDHLPTSNVDDITQRAEGLQKILEAAL